MSLHQTSALHADERPESEPPFCNEHHDVLPEGSHTAQRLRYGSAHHLHMTSRRFFIGPIPKGWLQSNRKSWYKKRLSFKHYSSRTVSFTADPVAEPGRQNSDIFAEHRSPTFQENDYQTYETETEGGETEEDRQGDCNKQGDVTSSGELRTLSSSVDEHNEDSQPVRTSVSPNPNRPQCNLSISYITHDAASSYVTARERADSSLVTPTWQTQQPVPSQIIGNSGTTSEQNPHVPSRDNIITDVLTPRTSSASEADSSAPLLESSSQQKTNSRNSQTPTIEDAAQPVDVEESGGLTRDNQATVESQKGKVTRFKLDDKLLDKQQRLRAQMNKSQSNVPLNRPHWRKAANGEIVKATMMLVRVEETLQKQLPDDYTENESVRMDTRIVDKWREYSVVCRRTFEEQMPFVLQMYKSRVILKVQKQGSKKTPRYEIRLHRKSTHANLYSSLDKTFVIWHPCRRGTRIYILRPRSAAHSVEWYTFIRQSLGWRRPSSLRIYVPDLGVSLIFRRPFEQLDHVASNMPGKGKDDGILSQSAVGKQLAADAIIRGCMKMLKDQTEWADVFNEWSKSEKMGLAWKRYDRLEWIFGVNEKKMHGSIAMQTSHDLELRPRHHYSTMVNNHDGHKDEEPQPVEGFLIRLTSQMGVHQRFKRMFFKRLYFFTQDHYLLFCKPSKAVPPTPPNIRSGNDPNVPSTQEILDDMPLSYDIDPYPVRDGEITWLSKGNEAYVMRHDEDALAQCRRNLHNISEADGYIDLRRVIRIRKGKKENNDMDRSVEEGHHDASHSESRNSYLENDATGHPNDDQTFEMCLANGLVVRLQSYNVETRDEWIKRLDALVKYWKIRTAADAAEIIATREQNLKVLCIDEEMESILGQFAQKWEVKKAVASPHLHNMCMLSGCRTIRMSGQLYRRPKRRASFKRCEVILTAGKLLVFQSSLRTSSGAETPFIHQELEAKIYLQDCYIYSGLLTESDMLYANQTFDSNHPGHHVLPRVYLSSDMYTNCDEDTATSFVIWRPQRRSFFRTQETGETGQTRQKLRHVSALGAYGRSILFKARSRVEKDRWVLAIAAEIDRLQEERPEEIRIVSPQ